MRPATVKDKAREPWTVGGETHPAGSLLAADLDAAMARHVENYRDEWAETLADPAKLARFRSFVNAPTTPDPGLAHVPERGQLRPARPEERGDARVLIAGTTLEVRR